MSEAEIQNDEPIIPEEDFREAIAACRQDPDLDRYFKLAPRGARLFIGLSFYSTHFGEKTDKTQYQACLAEIEPSLMPADLKYLIRFERDKETKKYLRDLLKRREAEEDAAESVEPSETSVQERQLQNPRSVQGGPRSVAAERLQQPQESGGIVKVPGDSPVDPMVELRENAPRELQPETGNSVSSGRGAPTRIRGVSSLSGLRLVADAEPTGRGRSVLPLAIVVGIAAVLAFSCLFLVNSRTKLEQELERSKLAVATLQHRLGELQRELERTQSELAKVKSAVDIQVPAPVVRTAPTEVEPETPEPQDEPAETAEDSGRVAEPAETQTVKTPLVNPSVKVVFTDGRKIERRSGGKLIEVPRTFSYSGAGLKKPFWIYDRKLTEAKMEAEAKLEQQARTAWKVLYDEAKRQEEAAKSTE